MKNTTPIQIKEMSSYLLSLGWNRTSLSFSTLEKERPDLNNNLDFFWFKEGKYLTVDLTVIPGYNWVEPTKQTKYFTLEEAYDSEFKN
jgi:hypothetical protein